MAVDEETGKSKCFGFISFKEHEQAEAAVEEMDGKEVDGKVTLMIYRTCSILFLKIENLLRPRPEEGGARGRAEGKVRQVEAGAHPTLPRSVLISTNQRAQNFRPIRSQVKINFKASTCT